MGMELWACGFNAFNQLQFVGDIQAEPRDLIGFTCVLENIKIEILRTTISATQVWTSSGVRIAGFSDEMPTTNIRELGSIEVAGNDKLIELAKGEITQYNSWDDYLHRKRQALESLPKMMKIVANQTSFTALSSAGKVYTWGDARYEACLGREVTAQTPASEPCLVEDLSDLPDPIKKISSGGYATAALTLANDAYFWGRPGHPEELLTPSPTPLDLDGQDILDVSVGFNHLMVLTTDHRLFVVGDGGSGQLGLDAEKLDDWKEVILPLKADQRMIGVHAGYKNSFLIVGDGTYQ